MNFKIISLYLLLAIATSCSQPSADTLYPIVVNNKVGYIDSTGKVIIQPHFLSGEDFSEGLANVRLEGTYGYINATGEWAIAPQYDYAAPFSQGLAVVYLDGIAGCIDKKGVFIVKPLYANITSFEKGQAFVETFSRKKGIIDKQGSLIVDTAFSSIEPFVDGYSIVAGDSTREQFGVIDSTGKLLVNYGKYQLIEVNEGGYFRVHFKKKERGYTGFVDHSGKLAFSMPDNPTIEINDNPHEGLILTTVKSLSPEYGSDYQTFIDMNGDVKFGGEKMHHATRFSQGRAFVKFDRSEYFYIYDRNGAMVSNQAIDLVVKHFADGSAIVRANGLIGIIDRNGVFKLRPSFHDVFYPDIPGDYIFFDGNSPYCFVDNLSLGGIVNRLTGQIIMRPAMMSYNPQGFVNGLVQCKVSDKLSYANQAGKIIWQGQEGKRTGNIDLNTDIRQDAHYTAYYDPWINSKVDLAKDAINVTDADHFPKGKLSLLLFPDQDSSRWGFNGFKAALVNNTNQPHHFRTHGISLRMMMQAKDKYGQWRYIEQLPMSCYNPANDYTAVLQPGQYWPYVCIRYTGAFKTKLRLALICDEEATRIIYSNEIDGSINPAQMWKEKNGHYPYIMSYVNTLLW